MDDIYFRVAAVVISSAAAATPRPGRHVSHHGRKEALIPTIVRIKVFDNGPYRIKGPIQLLDADNNEYEVLEGRTVSLCRCGGSNTMPFCDGTHSRIRFTANDRAIREPDAIPHQGHELRSVGQAGAGPRGRRPADHDARQ